MLNTNFDLVRNIMVRDNHTCYYEDKDTQVVCSKILGVVHLVPPSEGGDNNPKNLVCCCTAHEERKKDYY